MKIVIFWCLTSISIYSLGQNIKNTEIAIGEFMPSLSLGKVMDIKGAVSTSYKDNYTFYDFRNKIVILDFWASTCASCIAGFPKMSELQKKFDKEIQIFLINPWENEEQIRTRLLALEKRVGHSIVPDNLPMLVDAKALLQLFPLRGEIGYHVWIGKDGKVILRGIWENTHEKKIKELLEGQTISFIQDNSNAYNAKSAPFFITKNDVFRSAMKYTSSFSRFINDYTLASPYGGNGVENLIDSIEGTVRTSLINMLFLDFYNLPLRDKIKASLILYGPKSSIETKDTSNIVLVENMYVYNKQRSPKTDEEFYTKRFCYEQIVPITISEEKRKQMMLEDLNRYFANELGIVAGMENREVSGLLLKISHPEKLMKSKFQEASRKGKTINGKYIEEHYGVQLKEFLRDYIKGLSNNKISYNGSIIDDLEYSDKVDLILPPSYDIQSIEELKGYLNKYGIDLVPGKKIVEMLVVKDIQKEANKLR